MDIIKQIIIPVACCIIASSGFWAYISKKTSKNTAEVEMLIGLGHDRIINLGTQYIKRGYICADEYENLYEYLYLPYSKLGGNGTAKKIIDEVNKLEVR